MEYVIYQFRYVEGVPLKPEAFFAALSNQTRLRCLMLLHARGEVCVCDLTGATGKSQPLISRHLARLREAKIVADRREGLWIHYRLHPDLPDWALEVLQASARGLAGTDPFHNDLSALPAQPDGPGPECCAPPVMKQTGVDTP